MNTLYKIFSSVKLGVYLILLYAIAAAVATFIENDFGTPSANWLVYRSVWFNLLNIMLVLNMLTVFVKFKMYKLKKLSQFMFHSAFIIIIIGAGITRFLSYEGVMHIREGETSNTIVTYDAFIKVSIDDHKVMNKWSIPVNFNALSGANFNEKLIIDDREIVIKIIDYVPNAAEVSKTENGKTNMVLESQMNQNQFPYDGLLIEIKEGDLTYYTHVFGKASVLGRPNMFSFNGLNYQISYGSETKTLPFSLSLTKFELEHYPGSMSPSSYQSFITLKDDRYQVNEEHKIYMNNVLSYDGIRFYQSSYDTDEGGTILSVNKDYLGTFITYLGYFLLSLGMFMSIFDKNSRFRTLSKKVQELSAKSTISIVLLALFSFLSIQTEAQVTPIDQEHASKFGYLLVQDRGGRVKPINTLANEMLRKISRTSTYKGMSADQVFLGMVLNPQAWAQEQLIKVKNPDVQKRLDVTDEHISLADMFDKMGQYKIQKDVETAYATAPARQSKYDKEIIKLDEKINILYSIINGDMLNIFPLKNDPSHKWYSPKNGKIAFSGEDSTFIYNAFRLYLQDLNTGLQTKDWSKADSSLSYIKIYQDTAGKDLLISDTKRKAEIFYNESALFRHLFEFYFIIGMIFLALLFTKLIFDKLNLKHLIWGFISIISLAFALHTFGLALRWYISGHAPWSNGYESMIYISWATLLAGILFAKTSKIALAATTVLSGTILLVAHLSWLDPEITNLVPVLQSYWLTIHVAVITGSYGFLALGALLGLINLLLMILKTNKNAEHLDSKILQITYISEMTLIAGLFLLSIGTFLGGVWANESWGRYWGWDSKETWALITMLVYAFVLHMRFIPKLKSIYTFNLMSFFSISTVIMTYFGVNYYLSGMHSYAKGNPIPIPDFVYYSVAIATVVAIWAYFKQQKTKN